MAIYSPPPTESTFDETFDSTFTDTPARIAGSRGGATFQKIGSSFAIRTRIAPVLKRTPRQTQSHARFHAVQSFWHTLSPTEKATFADEVGNYERVNSLGETYTMQPINLQNSANSNAVAIDESFLTEMPAPEAPPTITLDTAVFQFASQDFFIETDPSTLPGTHSMLIYATRPLSPGQLSAGNLFVYMTVVPPSQAPNNFNFFDIYEQRFGVNADDIGKVIFVALQFVSQVTFMTGLSIYGSAPIENT